MDRSETPLPKDPGLVSGLAYVDWLLKHRCLINGLAILLTLIGVGLSTRLSLRPSFSALLPQNLPSVAQLGKVMDRVGGTGLLLVGIESPSFRANRRFADRLAAELDKLPPGSIRDYEYNFKQSRDYFERFGLHYLKNSELSKLRDRLRVEIKEKVEKKKDHAFSSFLGLEDEAAVKKAEAPSGLEDNELLAKLDPRVKGLLEYPDDYLASRDGKLVVLSIRTATSSLSVGDAQKLTQKIRSVVNDLHPERFEAGMRVNFAGNVQRSLDEVDTVKHDIADTAILLVVLIVLCLYFFFQSWTLVGVLALNLLFALSWTMGFAQLSIGYLNTLTAFMSSLVVGTGINYSCILISRFLEERRRGREAREAIAVAVASTCLPTLAGSSTTAISFIALFAARNRGFSDFALIGGSGILLCWVAAFTLMPLWILALSRRVRIDKAKNWNSLRLGEIFAGVGRLSERHPRLLAAALIACGVVSAVLSSDFLKNPLEYDFRNLGNKVSLSKQGAAGLHKRIQDDVYRSSLTPAIALLENEQQGRAFCPSVRHKVELLAPDERDFQSCLSLYEILPSTAAVADRGPENAKLRAEVKQLMGNRWLKYSDSKIAALMLHMHEKASERPPEIEDMPDQLRRRFQTRDGKNGRVAYVYSDNAKPLEDGNNLLNYTKTFGDVDLEDGSGQVHAAGENFVLADLLRTIRVDGPKTSMLALLGVIVVTFFLTGGLRSGMVMSACLLVATLGMFGIQSALNLKFNFFNFIALPLTFGIGVDYPINVFMRCKELGSKNFPEALGTTGVAVFLCCSTTTIGYLTLFVASNQALVSFAKLALMGEAACLATTFLALPFLLGRFGKRA